MAALAGAMAAPKWAADAKSFCTLLGHTSSVNALKLRLGGVGDKSVLFSGSGDETIRCWDIKTGECIQELERAHTGYVSSLAMQGDYIMSSSFDRTICLWNAERRSLVKSIKAHAHCINALCMHDNGVVLSAAWDQCVRVWDLRVRQEGHGFVAALTLPSAPLSIESSGNEVFSGLHDSTIMASDLRTGAELSTFKGHGGYITSLQITSKGNQLLSGSQDGTVRMTDLRTGSMRTVLDSDKAVFSVHAREDGGTRCVMSGHADGVVRITNIITGAEVKRYAGEHEGQVFSMVSDFDGCLITGAGDGKIVCWGKQPTLAARVPERGGGAAAARGGGVGKGAAAVSLQRVWRGWMGRQRSKMQDRVKRPILEPNGGHLAAGAGVKVRSEHRVLYTLDGTEPVPGKAREILAGKGGLGEIRLPAEGGKATLRAKAVGRGGYESASVTIWRDFEWPAAPLPAEEKPKPTIEKEEEEEEEAPEPTRGRAGEEEAPDLKAPVLDAEKSTPSRYPGTDSRKAAGNSSISKPQPQQQQQKRVGGGFALPPREGSAARTPKKPSPAAEGESSGRKSSLGGRKGAEGAGASGRKSSLGGRKGAEGADASGRKSSLGGSAAASRKAPLS